MATTGWNLKVMRGGANRLPHFQELAAGDRKVSAEQASHGRMAALANAESARNIRQESDMNRIAIAVVAAGLLIPAIHATDTPAALPPPTVKVGDIAPDFTLTDQKGNKVSLHDFKGKKNVALAFYIFAFTGG
jgi:hypothetical protein